MDDSDYRRFGLGFLVAVGWFVVVLAVTVAVAGPNLINLPADPPAGDCESFGPCLVEDAWSDIRVFVFLSGVLVALFTVVLATLLTSLAMARWERWPAAAHALVSGSVAAAVGSVVAMVTGAVLNGMGMGTVG